MKIKALAAIVALFFATSTFAQVAEPTTTSTTIPTKGQAPANTRGTTTTKQKGQKHAEGDRNHGQANPEGKRRHDESEAQTTGQTGEKSRKEHAEGENHEGRGEKGKKEHAEGENRESHGEKGKMKKAENAPNGQRTEGDQKSMRDRKAKKATNAN